MRARDRATWSMVAFWGVALVVTLAVNAALLYLAVRLVRAAAEVAK